jgi:hypothetical protein
MSMIQSYVSYRIVGLLLMTISLFFSYLNATWAYGCDTTYTYGRSHWKLCEIFAITNIVILIVPYILHTKRKIRIKSTQSIFIFINAFSIFLLILMALYLSIILRMTINGYVDCQSGPMSEFAIPVDSETRGIAIRNLTWLAVHILTSAILIWRISFTETTYKS